MISASWKLRGKVFFFKDRKYYRLNQRSMLRSSEHFLQFLPWHYKRRLKHVIENFSLQKYLKRCHLHVVEISRKKILFGERACHLLNQRLMPKRRPKFVKPRLPFFFISGSREAYHIAKSNNNNGQVRVSMTIIWSFHLQPSKVTSVAEKTIRKHNINHGLIKWST